MAKYTVTMACGHEETIELFGKNSERERKIQYYESKGVCKECYKKQIATKESEQGLEFHVSILPYINEDNGSIMVSVWFDGNTRPYKDEIKSLGGYTWSERESAQDWYSFNAPPLCWNKTVSISLLEEETQKAIGIGATPKENNKYLFESAHYYLAKSLQKKWQEKQDKIAALEKPAAPNVLKGHKWNQKVYGKPGNFSVYLDGVKVLLSDEEAEEVREYAEKKSAYLELKETILKE